MLGQAPGARCIRRGIEFSWKADKQSVLRIEVFAGFLWPCGAAFLRPSSYLTLCRVCVPICFEIVEAFVCQRHIGAPQKRWQCGPLACLHGVTRGQVRFQAWQIQSRHLFGTVKDGSACSSRQDGSARGSQTGSFAGLCSFPSTPSQQSVSIFEWAASKMQATLWWVAFKAWFFACSPGCWNSKTIAGARHWQGRVVHHDVTGAVPMLVPSCRRFQQDFWDKAQRPNQCFNSTWTTWISDAKFQTPTSHSTHLSGARTMDVYDNVDRCCVRKVVMKGTFRCQWFKDVLWPNVRLIAPSFGLPKNISSAKRTQWKSIINGNR